jgi:hypothetical protein
MSSNATQEVLRIFIKSSNTRLRQAIVTGKHEVVRAEMEHLKNLSKRMRKVSEGTYD